MREVVESVQRGVVPRIAMMAISSCGTATHVFVEMALSTAPIEFAMTRVVRPAMRAFLASVTSLEESASTLVPRPSFCDSCLESRFLFCEISFNCLRRLVRASFGQRC